MPSARPAAPLVGRGRHRYLLSRPLAPSDPRATRMAGSPKDPDRPPGQPKYLPRLTYKPPEPDPEDEEAEELDEDGNPIPSAKTRAKPKARADGSPATSASPPKKKDVAPIDPPR